MCNQEEVTAYVEGNFRIIARLDIKGEYLIKGINLEGLRVLGDPAEFALRYYRDGIDEIIYMDAVASLYGRNHLSELLEKTTKHIFVPVTVGGGVRSVNDISNLLRAGADKVAINTAALNDPNLINEAVRVFGSQCIVGSIEAKKVGAEWIAYKENGREKTDINVITWAAEIADRGVGEILLTSVDREGTRQGFDDELNSAVVELTNIPIIASGGMGKVGDAKVAAETGVSAIAVADGIHYGRVSVEGIKTALMDDAIRVRML